MLVRTHLASAGEFGYVYQPKNIEIGFVVAGRRHHSCYTLLFMLPGLTNVYKDKEIVDGFLMIGDRFVDHKEAGEIALSAGQLEDERYAASSH